MVYLLPKILSILIKLMDIRTKIVVVYTRTNFLKCISEEPITKASLTESFK